MEGSHLGEPFLFLLQEELDVTTEENIISDVIAADQSELDRQQDADPVSQGLTVEQVQAMINASNANQGNLANEVRGLQGTLDRTTAEVGKLEENIISKLNGRIAREKYLGSLDDEERRKFEPILDANEALHARVDAMAAPTEATAPVQQADAQAQWAYVHGVVRDHGVNPNDQRVDYSIMTNPNMTDVQRQRAFYANLTNIVKADAQLQPASQPQQQQPATANPPVETGARSSESNPREEDLRDRYITGQLTTEQYKEEMTRNGFRV